MYNVTYPVCVSRFRFRNRHSDLLAFRQSETLQLIDR